MKPADRYLKIVEWSEDDRCYVGGCPGLMLGGIHGDDEATVYRELCQAVDEWIHIQQEDHEPLPPPTAGKDYSGKFVVRVGKDLHKELAVRALREGNSLNAYCVRVLRERPAEYGKHRTRNRAKRADNKFN
ncbi:MAG: toxin-antitoxin system HicB family antitoxin [Lentisphaerae bacterium]|nr:toxin-antitoxin system HicB family antitoxin [Lentisphaerota bacterium]